jgi:AcrR family transcriptional regulator
MAGDEEVFRMPASDRTMAARPASGPVRQGRPRLTERRKAEIRLEIARHAIDLFLEQGVSDTTAEQIAESAGISLRTLWRYVASKENCVRPLLDVGLEDGARRLRRLPVDRPIAEAWADETQPDESRFDTDKVLALVRLTKTEPGLRAVWLQVHNDAIPVIAKALAHRDGTSSTALETRVRAGIVNVALAIAVEQFASSPRRGRASLNETIRESLAIAERGIGTGDQSA